MTFIEYFILAFIVTFSGIYFLKASANEGEYGETLKHTLTELTVENPFGVGFTIRVDCRDPSQRGSATRKHPGKKLRNRYLPPKGTIVLMIDSPQCEITPIL